MKKVICVILSLFLVFSPAMCYASQDSTQDTAQDIMIIFTSDVHCGISEGFGYGGVKQIRDQLEEQGYLTLLVDDGDAISGEAIGTITEGEAIIEIMNALSYDVVIPGNHEFDYGMDEFMKLTQEADFPYICCNFRKNGELVFEPYIIKEIGGIKIAFVGIITPTSITTSTPTFFQDENGKFIYDFMQDDTSGEELFEAVQKAVDDARAQGADYVYALGHIGMKEGSGVWTYDKIIANTNGIDVFLDGHSHDTEQVVMKNKDGKEVPRSGPGTKLNCVGYSHISAKDGIQETNIWSWPNEEGLPELIGIHNDITDLITQIESRSEDKLNEVIGHTNFVLTTDDPEVKDDHGDPIRMIRRAETNLADFVTDAYRNISGADVAVLNAGAIRISVEKGNITYKTALDVFPFGDYLRVISVTGQQILDALEWGAKAVPDEFGGFRQVSGLSYEIDSSIPSGCVADSEGMLDHIEGERRVSNVKIGDEDLDPEKTYTLASATYLLSEYGDGNTAFKDSQVVIDKGSQDVQVLIDYVTNACGGEVPEEYQDPYGQGRINIVSKNLIENRECESFSVNRSSMISSMIMLWAGQPL